MMQRLFISFVFGSVCLASAPEVAHAQTRFEFPDSRVDVSKFRYVESCLAAAQRVKDSIETVKLEDDDTIALWALDGTNPLPRAVLDVTKRCLARFTPEDIPGPFAQIAQQAFLYAGRDADAEAVVRLRVNALADSVSRAYLLDSFARNYINASPRRVAAAHTIVDEVLQYGDVYPSLPRAGMCAIMARAAVVMHDTVSLDKYGRTALNAIKTARPEELDIPGSWVISLIVRELNQQVYKKQILDSLRVSTQAFLDIQTVKFNEVMKGREDYSAAGMQTVPLKANFWFPEEAANVEYPRKGKVTILNFPNPDPKYYDKYTRVIVRRLASRYPNADLVFAGRTRGYFGPKAEQEAAVEAEKQIQLFREFRGNTKAVVGIAISEVVELPPPDNRRVHTLPENYYNYPKAIGEQQVFIVDEDGILVERQEIASIHREIWLEELMAVLMERQKARQ